MSAKYFLAIAAASLMLAAVSCGASSVADRAEKFVEKFEKECSGYSEEKLQQAADSFEKLVEEYEQKYDKLSEEDRARFLKAVGKYHGASVKAAVDKAGDAIDEASDVFEGFVESLTEE